MDSIKTSENKIRWLAVRVALVATDLCLFTFAYWLAFAVRFDFDLSQVNGAEKCRQSIVLAVLFKTVVFFYYRHFHSYGLHATFRDFQVLAKSAVISSVGFFLLTLFAFNYQLPRSVPVLDCLFTICLIGTIRFAWRIARQEVLPRFSGKTYRRTLLIGANNQGVILAHELESHPELGYRIVGFVSLHSKKIGRHIGQIPVLGHLDELDKILTSHRIEDVLTLTDVINGKQLRQVMDICHARNLRLRVVPSMETRLGGTGIPIREIKIEDLLKRDPIQLDDSSIARMISGKRVLVTGAGGSIGSEICRQLIRFAPETLIILGRGENRIFYLEHELRELGYQSELIPIIADVANAVRMNHVFDSERPNVIFHAAAHKHVPLMETNVTEAIRNNVLGTKIVADLADQYGTSAFVLISTDKAVNPTSTMGASKHMAERYVHSLASRSQTKFVVTRFGNVLGSAGSVVPIFKRQIAQGGPICITDFRMTRYFMTIPEASQLVMQAGAMGEGGEIFVLDMGEPIHILDLAKDLIRLSGLSENSIEIVESGMRPGEKLYEELYFDTEQAIPTTHPKLRCALHRQFEWSTVEEQITELIKVMENPTKIHAKLEEYISEYQPTPAVIRFKDQVKPISRAS